MIKNFTPKDLSDEMVVETKCGKRYLVYNGRLIGEAGCLPCDMYNDDLINIILGDPYTIVKVYRIPRYFIIHSIHDFLTDNYVKNYSLIWKREKRVDLTLEEIENMLGYKINLIDTAEE